MSNYSEKNFLNESEFIFNQRISWYKKKKNNFKWAEDCTDFLDHVYTPKIDSEEQRRMQMNYNIYNGNGAEIFQNYGNNDLQGDPDLESGYENIPHHPAMEQIAKAMVGEQQMRPLNPIAFDSSGYANNQRKRKRLELYQNYLEKTIIDPIRQQVTMQLMQSAGIQDPYSMSPEEQQQFQQEVEHQTQVMTPKEIEGYMRKDYKAPSEKQAQKIIEFLNDYLDIKFVTDEGFKHGVITGKEVYKTGIRHNMPYMELVDLFGFSYISRPNTFFIEQGVAWKYEQYVMINDIYGWHGNEIDSNRDLKHKLDVYASELSTDGRKPGAPNPQFVAEVQRNPALIENAPDIRTPEGQNYIKNIYQTTSGVGAKGGDVRYTHFAWKGLRKLYYVHRINQETGGVDKFWVDESYHKNKKLDLKCETHWVPELWQTTKVGDTDGIYFDKEPIPYQNKSLDNPWDIKGPYVGAVYSRLMNNTRATSPMDLAQPYQHKYNVQLAKIEENEARDIGKILTMSFHAKPKDWSWKKWLLMAKNKGVLPVDLKKEGATPMDAQAFKGIDLSNIDRLAGQLEYLHFLKNQIANAMSYNMSRLGMVGNEVSVTNNQQNIMQSSYQTYDIYNIHNKIVENLYNVLINITRVAWKDNPPIKNYMLDDMSIAELDVDWEMLWRSEIGIKVRNSSQDFENILQVKQHAQSMIQNGLISFPDLIRLQGAKSWGEIQNIAEHATEEMEKKQAQQQEEQQALLEKQKEIQEQLIEKQREFDLLKQEKELESRERQSVIESERFALQKDIDKDGINDDIQREEAKMVAEQRKQIRDLEFELEKLNEEIRKNKKAEELKEKELEIKRMEAKAKLNKPSSS